MDDASLLSSPSAAARPPPDGEKRRAANRPKSWQSDTYCVCHMETCDRETNGER